MERLKKEKEKEIFDFKDETLPEQKKLKRDANTVEDYYRAWDNYNVDKELERLEDKPKETKPEHPMKEKEKPKPNQKI